MKLKDKIIELHRLTASIVLHKKHISIFLHDIEEKDIPEKLFSPRTKGQWNDNTVDIVIFVKS